jgi:hypothetical protein
MGNDLTRWMRDEQGEGVQLERYGPLPAHSRWGLADRRREGRHVLIVRDLERQTQEGIAREARDALVALARQERLSRELDEAKLKLERARRTSQIVAGDDPELRMQFEILETEFFQQIRRDLGRWTSRP